MSRRVPRVLTGLLALAVAGSALASAPTAAASSTFSISAPATIRTGDRLVVTGAPGRALAGRLAVLETVGGKRPSFQLQTGTVRPDGTIRLASAIGLPGSWDVRVRILQGRTTIAQSNADTVRVRGAVRQPTATEAASGLRMLSHARTQRQTTGMRGRSLTATPAGIDPVVAQTIQSLTVAEDAISGGIGAPQVAQQQFGSGDSWTSLLSGGLVDWGVGFAMNLIVGALFPGGSGGQTQQALGQISGQLQQMQAQLAQIESSLSTLQTQVNQDFARVQAIGNDALCLNLLQQANGYVDSLQVLQDQAQITLNQQWLAVNAAPYANSPAAIRAIGNQMFGSGPGTPSFANGLIAAQQDVTNLAALLVDDGSTGTPGLVSTCASSIAGQIVAANPTPANGVTAVGSVDAAYFTQLQQVVAYYTTWVAIGQVLTAQGGQMAIAQLSPQPLTTASSIQRVCAGAAAAGTPSLLTCPGLLAQINATQQAIANAWNLTGASWGQVSDGLLGADTQVNAATDSFVPAVSAWPIDLATYGSANPAQAPVVTSTGVATGPAAAVMSGGAPTLGTTSWAGASFVPANAAVWDRLLGVASMAPYPGATTGAAAACITQSSGSATSCAASGTISQAMGRAGLLANGTTPSNLILYTGETSTWNLASASSIGQLYFSGNNTVVPQNVPTLGVNAFLDTNFVPVQGASVVIGAPGSALTPASVYPYVADVQALSSAAQYPGLWQLTTSANQTPALNGYPSGYPSAFAYCYPAPPLSKSGLPLTMGQILGLPNGQSTLVSNPQPNCGAFLINGMNPMPLTPNATFYAPVNLQYVYDSGNSVTGANTILASTLPGWVSGSTGPGAGGILAQQSQYLWPVVPLAKNPTCALTTFTQGVTGSLGVTNTCASLWQEWSAVNTGLSTGPVQLTAPITQGAQQPGGASAAGVVLTNASPSSQLATLTIASGSGGVQPQGMLTPVGPNGPLPTGCQSPNGIGAQAPTAPSSSVSCTFVVPPGVSSVSIPVTFSGASSGTLMAALSGSGIASATTIAVTNSPAVPAQPPAAVTNLSVTGSTGTTVTLAWQVPASSLPITGYTLSIQTPSGSTSSQQIPASSVTIAGANASATVTLPAQQAGYWQFQLAASSSAGTGLQATTTAYLGSGPPPAPANLTAVENPDGTVSLSWTPITALPPVSGYTVVATDPSGIPRTPVTVSVPAFTTGALMRTGTWTFSVTATSTAGTGPASTATASLLGTAPSAPTALTATVSDNGWVSAAWAAPADGVPAPTSYVLRVYDSGGRAVREMVIASTGIVSTVSVPRFFTLGSNSPTGSWTVVVAARNATGLGQSARSVLEVTPGLVSGIGSTQSIDAQFAKVPLLLADLDASECRAGFAIESTFGTCTKRSWTPRPS